MGKNERKHVCIRKALQLFRYLSSFCSFYELIGITGMFVGKRDISKNCRFGLNLCIAVARLLRKHRKQGSSETQYYLLFALKYFQASQLVFDSHKFINKSREKKKYFMDIFVSFSAFNFFGDTSGWEKIKNLFDKCARKQMQGILFFVIGSGFYE